MGDRQMEIRRRSSEIKPDSRESQETKARDVHRDKKRIVGAIAL